MANYLGDVAAVCEAAGVGSLHARFLMHREGGSRACAAAFGYRLMMSRVVPGGVAHDLAPAGATPEQVLVGLRVLLEANAR